MLSKNGAKKLAKPKKKRKFFSAFFFYLLNLYIYQTVD